MIGVYYNKLLYYVAPSHYHPSTNQNHLQHNENIIHVNCLYIYSISVKILSRSKFNEWMTAWEREWTMPYVQCCSISFILDDDDVTTTKYDDDYDGKWEKMKSKT